MDAGVAGKAREPLDRRSAPRRNTTRLIKIRAMGAVDLQATLEQEPCLSAMSPKRAISNLTRNGYSVFGTPVRSYHSATNWTSRCVVRVCLIQVEPSLFPSRELSPDNGAFLLSKHSITDDLSPCVMALTLRASRDRVPRASLSRFGILS